MKHVEKNDLVLITQSAKELQDLQTRNAVPIEVVSPIFATPYGLRARGAGRNRH